MVVRGVGSITSPIIISDDEDEAVADVLKEVTRQNVEFSATYSSTPNAHTSSSVAQTVGYSMALRMGFRPGCGLGLQLDGKQICR
ncbi:hypothetical protein BS17DRAFT_699417 [Gyrodon lividus]|nr:hypothetical protein BS17DRAFT_699417 [Gyrodon lividus]